MKQFITVSGWDEFQHYKDRNPPWIKLHNHLLDNYEFECLGDSAKGHLLCIWMLASRTGNKIPYDATWIKKKIGASTSINLDSLINAGFLCLEHDASTSLHNEKHDATECVPSEEKRRGEERQIREENSTEQQVALVPIAESCGVCYLPLNDGSAFTVTGDQFDKWIILYPSVDVESELRKMIGWLDANPSKRKTRKGVMRFANGWLAKQQDKPTTNPQPQAGADNWDDDNWHKNLGM